MKITIPDFCLVGLIGPSGPAPSAFVRRTFGPADIAGTDDDLDAALAVAGERLARREIAVVQIASASRANLQALAHLAKTWHVQRVALLAGPVSPGQLDNAGFHTVHELPELDPEQDLVEIVREPLAVDRRGELAPFDIIGDVHGCADELIGLLQRLGYGVDFEGDDRRALVTPPFGRRAVFVGDLADRGPNAPDVLRIVMAMVEAGQGLCVPGNHDAKLRRWLGGRDVKPTHGFDKTMAQLAHEPPEFHARVRTFFDSLATHLWLDGGRLVVAHAGIAEAMVGRSAGAVREFCLYGDTDGQVDRSGLAIRYNWAADYRGAATVVYGHTPVEHATWVGNTVCIDTGCCFGAKLTALRWPEREVVTVPARATYAELRRPLGLPAPRPQS